MASMGGTRGQELIVQALEREKYGFKSWLYYTLIC